MLTESVDKLYETVNVLPDKLGQLVAAQPQYQPYLPFQQTPFHSTFPQPHQQSEPAPNLTTANPGGSEKMESEETKVVALNLKHKVIWDTLVQIHLWFSIISPLKRVP
jgi:hypothetical protein